MRQFALVLLLRFNTEEVNYSVSNACVIRVCINDTHFEVAQYFIKLKYRTLLETIAVTAQDPYWLRPQRLGGVVVGCSRCRVGESISVRRDVIGIHNIRGVDF